ncbi:P-loop containing nucleoside triphosphate hydrolase protein [Lipomyces japonicus]|uniref:P-loop containing nucleoside triphosphate hydrolase protein n=1 Tax=Lipomyces japonicus TaxID=56871 RepID=UPI0034CD358C
MTESKYAEVTFNEEPASSESTSIAPEHGQTSAWLHFNDYHPSGPILSFNNVESVDVTVRDLSVSISLQSQLVQQLGLSGIAKKIGKKSEDVQVKHILNDINLDVQAGSVMAIIGGSGSGKTSLLNVLAGRMKSGALKVEGQVTFNGHANIHKVRHAYVLQQDILLPTLTTRETLLYAADLRLPSTTTKDERRSLVEQVILELGLKECADTFVGDNDHRGLSGGEKRRLSIGIQLLSNPSILFLDEPTTGLDAFSAQLLVKTLRKLARKGRTFITSIHQPRSDIFFLFDSITLLSKGQPVYSGPVVDSLSYFDNLGYKIPRNANPADVLIDLAAYDSRSERQREESKARIVKLVTSWKKNKQFDPVTLAPEPGPLPQIHAPLLREIMVLTKRTMKTTYRDSMGLLGCFLEAVINGIACGWIFYGLDGSLIGIRSQFGVIYAATASQGYLIQMYEAYRLSSVDIKVFDRERNEGMVSVTGFLVSRRLARLLTEDIMVPLIYSTIIYFMVGFPRNAHQYFLFFLNVLLQHYGNICLATMSVSIARDYSVAVLIANFIATMQTMSCGFYIQSDSMPVYVRWLRWLSFQYYGFSATMNVIFDNFFGDCPYGDASNQDCYPYTGEYQLLTMGVRTNWLAKPFAITVAICVIIYFISGLVLYVKPFDISVAASKPSLQDAATAGTKRRLQQSPTGNDELQPRQANRWNLSIRVQDLRLSISKRDLLFRIHKIDILRGISTTFEPGKINAILGPSGSGKSSLLNFIALRLHSSISAKYSSSGDVLFGGQKTPSEAVLKSICSYVTQEDDGLLATLTVRETLRFAAELRLPAFMNQIQKHAKVEEIIAKMGLSECADTLIGSEFVKGISGGEKRRVSISVQLLNEPKILLLDEPTSGLDSFTAASLLDVLKELANEGRTIVCTIHQPRSDLFSYFGNVLLLAKGGRVAYSGQGQNELLNYFARLGYACPELTNPADHVLDLVSVNLQDPDSESVTRKRVIKLLEHHDRTVVDRNEKLHRAGGIIIHPAELGGLKREPTSFRRAFPVLLKRSYVDLTRNPVGLIARLGQIVGFGVLMALFFSPLRHDYAGVINRIGVIQQFSALYFVGMLCNIALYPMQRDIFYREHDDGVYGVFTFLATYSFYEVPLEMFNSLIFSVFMVMVTGINRSAAVFFVSALVSFCIVNCGESVGIGFNSVFKHAGFAANMTSVALSIGTLMSGIMSFQMMGFIRGFSFINPLMYASIVLMDYVFEGLEFSCDERTRLSDGACPLPTGQAVLDTYEIKPGKAAYLGGLVGIMVAYRLLASLLLKVLRLRFKIGRPNTSSTGTL